MSHDSENRMQGSGYILAYAFIGAIIDVVLSHLLQNLPVFVLLFWTFLGTWSGFVLITLLFRPVRWSHTQPHLPLIFLINIVTAGAWAGLFIGLKWIEPSLMVAIIFGLSPVMGAAYEYYQGRPISGHYRTVIVGLTLTAGLLLYLAVDHKRYNPFSSVWLFSFCLLLLCGLTAMSLSAYTYLSRHLHQQDFSAVQVQALRFPLLLICVALALPQDHRQYLFSDHFWSYLAVIVLLGNILPLWLLQKGIQRAPALYVTIIINVSPLLTMIFELFDPALQYYHGKLLAILLLCGLLMLSNEKLFLRIRQTLKQV
ncbi:EamA family transporter [Gynuella sp.]|uniref:EamA family transporter n=1 Tax=Gynuella sp. TaxID=2969146 RepID=UPI003D09B6AE